MEQAMTKEQPEPGIGDVPLDLDGKEVVLKPSLRACMGISRLHGAPYETAHKVMQLDFDTTLKVLAFGLQRAPNKDLEEALYRTGLINVRDELVRFIHVVNNGGRPPDPVKLDDGGNPIEEPDEENPQTPSQ